jgi:hypothetical protein
MINVRRVFLTFSKAAGFCYPVQLKFSLTRLPSRVYGQQVFLDKFTFSCVQSRTFPWQVYFLVCTVNKLSLTSLLSRVYSQQVFHVYFLVCTVNKLSLTSLPSRVYSQQVFLDKFTFSCVRSTSFPWQVSLLVCTVNKLSLTSLLSRVYGQQVFLDKFSLTRFVALVHGMLLNIYLESRPPFVCQKPRKYFLCTCQVFLGGRTHEQIFLVPKLACLALEQGFLTRKKDQFFTLHTSK